MPNSFSPLRVHSQQSLSRYSILSSSPKMIPDAWSTDDPGGNSTTNTCADSFTASSKAKVSHIIKVKSKSISYHALSLSFPLSLILLAWQSERSNQPALGVSLPIWNQLPGIPSLIAYLALLSSSHLQRLIHFQRRDHFCKGEQVRQVKMTHWSMWRQAITAYAELSSNPLQYELERLNKETEKRE